MSDGQAGVQHHDLPILRQPLDQSREGDVAWNLQGQGVLRTWATLLCVSDLWRTRLRTQRYAAHTRAVPGVRQAWSSSPICLARGLTRSNHRLEWTGARDETAANRKPWYVRNRRADVGVIRDEIECVGDVQPLPLAMLALEPGRKMRIDRRAPAGRRCARSRTARSA